MALETEHRKYYNKDKKEIPSVTTILKIINKPSLLLWANSLGFKRQSYNKVLNEKANKGTLVHYIIEKYLRGEKMAFPSTNFNNKKLVLDAIDKFLTWYKKSNIEVKEVECVLESDEFGGTCDLLCIKDNKLTLIDFKTSKDIYITMVLQLAGYIILLEEKGYVIEQVGIVTIPEDKPLKEKYISREDMELYIKTFKSCLRFYIDYTKIEELFKK